MAAIVINNSTFEDDISSWKTYYIIIHADGCLFYKFGVCHGAIRKRYSREPSSTHIEIIHIWTHKSERSALAHERKLFKEHPGIAPFIGRCGPLKFGGNTETYCHDAFGGEQPPDTYLVQMLSEEHGSLFTRAFCKINPLNAYRHLYGQVRYMDYAFGPERIPEGPYLHVAQLSSRSSVLIATDTHLENVVEGRTWPLRKLTKSIAGDALRDRIIVNAWEDYRLMSFRGDDFKAPKWSEWV